MHLKSLSIQDKKLVEDFVKNFLPFSDYSFLSLFTYNTDRTTQFGFWRDCLVIKFEDYLTKAPFYSYLGTDPSGKLAGELLAKSAEEKLEKKLKLFPEASITDNLRRNFQVEEDRDNFDYLIEVGDVSELSSKKMDKKRRSVQQFLAQYPNHKVELIDLTSYPAQFQILRAFHEWKNANGKTDFEVKIEEHAIIRLFEYIENFPDAKCVGVYINEKLVAFNIFDIVSKSYAISSFQKADKHYPGIYAFLTQQMAKYLQQTSIKFMNFEQDLGIEGLRISKTTWHPKLFLKKYTVREKAPS